MYVRNGWYVAAWDEEVGRSLAQAIPQWFKVPYSQMMASLMNRFGVPEETILTTFGKLLAVRQTELLGSAAALTERGGSIVYCVCSLEPEEGEDVVRGFLASQADFRLADPRPLLSEEARAFVREPGWLVTTPVAGDLDGFFAARLERRSE